MLKKFSQSAEASRTKYRDDDDSNKQACTPLAIGAAIERGEDVLHESRRGFRTCHGLASDSSEGKDTWLTLGSSESPSSHLYVCREGTASSSCIPHFSSAWFTTLLSVCAVGVLLVSILGVTSAVLGQSLRGRSHSLSGSCLGYFRITPPHCALIILLGGAGPSSRLLVSQARYRHSTFRDAQFHWRGGQRGRV